MITKTKSKQIPKSNQYDSSLKFDENMVNLGWMTNINKRVVTGLNNDNSKH